MQLKFKLIHLFILALASITVIYSCRKTLKPNLAEKRLVPPEAEWALTYYNQVLHPKEVNFNIQSKKPPSVSGNTKLNVRINKSLVWRKAILGNASGYTYVEVPIRYSSHMSLTLDKSVADSSVDETVFKASFHRLIMYKNKSGVIYQKIVSYVPEKAYLLRHEGDISHNRTGKLDDDFDGYIFHREWSGDIMFVLQIKKGKLVKQISVGTKLSNKKNQQKASAYTCIIFPIYHIFTYCYYEGDNPDPLWCEPAQSEYCCDGEYCYYEEGNNGVDCSDPAFFDHPECLGYYEEVDCAGVPGGSAVFDRRCGCIGGTTGIDSCPPCPTTKVELKAAFPSASDANMEELSTTLNNYAEHYGIDTEEEMQHFLAQAAHETNGFQSLTTEENLYYTSAQRLMDVWPSRFSQTDPTKADPDDYLRSPEKLANFVYANRMGNGNAASGDGWRFRGRGIFQLTGRENYRAFAFTYGGGVQDEPDPAATIASYLSNSAEVSIVSALWFYNTHVLHRITVDANTTVEKMTRLVNGGVTGILDRKTKTIAAKSHIDC